MWVVFAYAVKKNVICYTLTLILRFTFTSYTTLVPFESFEWHLGDIPQNVREWYLREKGISNGFKNLTIDVAIVCSYNLSCEMREFGKVLFGHKPIANLLFISFANWVAVLFFISPTPFYLCYQLLISNSFHSLLSMCIILDFPLNPVSGSDEWFRSTTVLLKCVNAREIPNTVHCVKYNSKLL